PRDDDLLLLRRWLDLDDHARRAAAAGHAVRRQTALQRALLGSRGPDDLPLHHSRLRRARELRDPADDRRTGHGLPAPERPFVLAAAACGADDALELPRPGLRL